MTNIWIRIAGVNSISMFHIGNATCRSDGICYQALFPLTVLSCRYVLAPEVLRRVRIEEPASPPWHETGVVAGVPLRQGDCAHHSHHQQAGEEQCTSHGHVLPRE